VRGIAVLVMIEAHTLDSWTRASDRASTAFGDAMVLAGFAAPLFLWLAGISVVLAAEAAVRRGLSRRAAAESVCRRGLEIFVLAFLFRLQAFVISPGAHPVTLFRVDILNIMGPGIAMAGLVWLMSASRPMTFAIYSALAAAFAMLTPVVRVTAALDWLPIWVQWYIRPAGDNTTFTGFPWAGFVFAGAATGVLLVVARESHADRRMHMRLAFAGILTAAAGYYTASLPSIYRQSSFWTTSPTYFAVRVGVLTTVLAAVYFIERLAADRRVSLSPLARLGRQSLFVYWIHVELVYGYATWALHRRLPLWGAVAAYAMFSSLMYAAVVARDRVVEVWRQRKQQIPLRHRVESV
jgi:uncharacterized membrane protein